MSLSPRMVLTTGKVGACLLLLLGIFWSFTRGANDFHVFFAAWTHVLRDEGAQIYTSSPDRFLYAPGFAWVFAPFALLPEKLALALWCLAKSAGVLWLLSTTRNRYWALLLLARPVLIDLQYGQVNLLILIACAWAMNRHLERDGKRSWKDGASWFFVGVAAIGKLFPLPLLLVPFLATRFSDRPIDAGKLRVERLGAILGVVFVLTLPVLALGLPGTLTLMGQWKAALLERGLPLESHNQSFAAFLHHFMSGEPTEIISLHRKQIWFGWKILSEGQIEGLSLLWTALWGAFTLYMVGIRSRKTPVSDAPRWSAIVCALLIVPSHLVWKPYFVMGLPAAILATEAIVKEPTRKMLITVAAVFILMNLTGFDVVGQALGARFEAAAMMLTAHLILIAALLFFRTDASLRT